MRAHSVPGAVVVGIACLLLGVRGANAYRFFLRDDVSSIASAAAAGRWHARDLPLRYRLLENDLVPGDSALRSVVTEAFAAWNSVSTSTFRVELEETTAVAEQLPGGTNELGFAVDAQRVGVQSFARIRWRGPYIVECDIPIHPGGVDAAVLQEHRDRFLYLVIHEFGHCLGLDHSEEYPMSIGVEGVPSNFSPSPVMAYSKYGGLELTRDDRVGVSLLYPTPAFQRSHGAVGGRVAVQGEPARHVYVQALELGGDPEAGPGAFTDRDGNFLLEGLPPGPVVLWVHPMLITVGDPHPGLRSDAAPSEGRSAIQDQWRWARVIAGETRIIRDILAVTGRLEPP